ASLTPRRPGVRSSHRPPVPSLRVHQEHLCSSCRAPRARTAPESPQPAHVAIFQNLGPEGARIGELAERAKLTNQSVGYLVDYLEEHGYVERRPDPRNRRATLVCFTERGWDEADACARILGDLDKELTRRVGAGRLQQLQALLVEVTDALREGK